MGAIDARHVRGDGIGRQLPRLAQVLDEFLLAARHGVRCLQPRTASHTRTRAL